MCGLPPDFCEYGPDMEKCRPWLQQHALWVLEGDEEGELAEDMDGLDVGDKKKKKKSKRGGQGAKKKVVDESKQQVFHELKHLYLCCCADGSQQ